MGLVRPNCGPELSIGLAEKALCNHDLLRAAIAVNPLEQNAIDPQGHADGGSGRGNERSR